MHGKSNTHIFVWFDDDDDEFAPNGKQDGWSVIQNKWEQYIEVEYYLNDKCIMSYDPY